MSVFVVAAKRTAIGTFGGKLAHLTATELQALAFKGALSSGKIDPKLVDSVVVGNVAHTSRDAPYLARHAALHAGVRIETPCLTVNRLCGSGFESIVSGAQNIKLGEAEIVMTGGSENMSMAPYSMFNARFSTPRLGKNVELEDTLWQALTDSYIKTPMAITAENLAEQYKLDRATVDAFALRSQQLWKKAQDAGHFKAEIEPVTVPGKKKGEHEHFAVDEHPRPETTAEGLANLKPVFKADGVVTAGNASGIGDGAASLVLASEAAVKRHGLKPLARVVSWQSVGCDPKIMGIGPVGAIQGALARAKLTLGQMDLIEVNEAFAAQALAVEKAMGGFDRSKFNASGGAVALAHPLGASGNRISAHLVHALHRIGGKYAVGSACIGGGQGIAVIFERV